MAHVRRLTAAGIRPQDIGIITPYNAQVGERVLGFWANDWISTARVGGRLVAELVKNLIVCQYWPKALRSSCNQCKAAFLQSASQLVLESWAGARRSANQQSRPFQTFPQAGM